MDSNIIRASHVGNDESLETIKRSYWFPKMGEKMKTYISNCLKCITYNLSSGKRQGFLHTLDKGDLPFYTVQIDYCGRLGKTKCGNRYIVAIIDGFTKCCKLFPCKTTNTNEALKHFHKYFYYYRKTLRLISDRGSAFTFVAFKNFMEESDVENVLIAVGIPRVNGQIERLNKDIIHMLAKITENPAKWDEVLEKVEYAINNTVNRSIKDTPTRLLFGINQRGKLEDCLK
ncbi:hypothetical protein Trydic_g14119 [Trypoxylus dichotomus]